MLTIPSGAIVTHSGYTLVLKDCIMTSQMILNLNQRKSKKFF